VAAGAFVMDRNMFGPVRGDWDRRWQGWWGENPPYHAPVFVLTHHPRQPLTMQGGTTFTFVTDGLGAALDQARKAAGDGDVAIAGGAATVNQYLAAGLVDELRTHIAPVTLGGGERLFDGVPPLHLEFLAVRAASLTTHISYRLLH
jgi:dihydrofolate reductase